MPLEQLCYTKSDTITSHEHPKTFVLMVDVEMYAKYAKDKSIPSAEVVDSFDVLCYENPGKSGRLERPSKRELTDTFGTHKEDAIVEFMLQNGKLHGKQGEIYDKVRNT